MMIASVRRPARASDGSLALGEKSIRRRGHGLVRRHDPDAKDDGGKSRCSPPASLRITVPLEDVLKLRIVRHDCQRGRKTTFRSASPHTNCTKHAACIALRYGSSPRWVERLNERIARLHEALSSGELHCLSKNALASARLASASDPERRRRLRCVREHKASAHRARRLPTRHLCRVRPAGRSTRGKFPEGCRRFAPDENGVSIVPIGCFATSSVTRLRTSPLRA